MNTLKACKFLSLALVSSMCIKASLAHTALNPDQVLEFAISKDGLTRISIDNDGIDDLYAYPTDYADNISYHKSGHVFVAGDDLEGPFYVTLITRRGVAQDLRLVPRAKKAAPILLHFEEPAAPASSPQDVYADILGQFVRGIVPTGFRPVTVVEVSRGDGSTAEALLDRAYQQASLRVLVFTVQNTGLQPLAPMVLPLE